MRTGLYAIPTGLKWPKVTFMVSFSIALIKFCSNKDEVAAVDNTFLLLDDLSSRSSSNLTQMHSF